ncbi:MAG: hypothetical protein WAM82_10590 [Thermoanaerobaculia bacterium]
MKREIGFGCMRRDGAIVFVRLQELIQRAARVYAGGFLQENSLSEHLVRGVFETDREAYLLMVLPDPEFGILELRYWASDELLVPVPEHSRCVYGLQLGKIQEEGPEQPFPFFPRELDHLGFLVASGPKEFAVLDYRGQMAEAKINPFQGGPLIVGFLNRRNLKTHALITELSRFSDGYELRRSIGQQAKRLRLALTLGEQDKYHRDARNHLVEALNLLCAGLNLDIRFRPDDLPAYFDGSQSRPFGRPLIEPRAFQVATSLEHHGVRLS